MTDIDTKRATSKWSVSFAEFLIYLSYFLRTSPKQISGYVPVCLLS